MSKGVPLTPTMAVTIALSIAGLAFVLLSRNVAAKRIVLPGTLFVFSAAFFLGFRQSEWATQIPSVVIIVALILNAAWVWRVIAYCERCGRTVHHSVGHDAPRILCEECEP